MRVYIYTATQWQGEPVETLSTKKPQWFAFNQVPYDFMFEGEGYWFPYLLAGQEFVGEVWYNQEARVLDHKVKTATAEEVEELLSQESL